MRKEVKSIEIRGYMGIVVLVNLAFMIHETQWVSASADAALDMGAEARWSVDETFFNVAEYASGPAFRAVVGRFRPRFSSKTVKNMKVSSRFRAF